MKLSDVDWESLGYIVEVDPLNKYKWRAYRIDGCLGVLHANTLEEVLEWIGRQLHLFVDVI